MGISPSGTAHAAGGEPTARTKLVSGSQSPAPQGPSACLGLDGLCLMTCIVPGRGNGHFAASPSRPQVAVSPQMVGRLLQVPADPMARAVDCLRILTSGNESNKLALTSSSSSLPSLVRLMDVRLTSDMVLLERAAAVLGNLSTSGERPGSEVREAGCPVQKPPLSWVTHACGWILGG